METIELEISGFRHQASLHRAMGHRVNKTIVYYHGGGFIFGSKDDLPVYAIHTLTSAGYDLLCMEYPKAPEMSLSQICDFVEQQLMWYLENHKNLDLSKDYILFGRSAGGYLALCLAKIMVSKKDRLPSKLIIFYGYETLNKPEFILCSDYYLNYPKLTWDDVKSAVEKQPVFETIVQKRYPLYIYARQTGQWLSLLGINEIKKKEEIGVQGIEIPDIFLAASFYDKDVRYQNSLEMNKEYSNSLLFTSWSNKHEFDEVENSESVELYKRLLEWIY
ncbi:MAG: alpha/beta hydrolase [Erysipelotrichaceae bacterium]|nr:alpha/beta hydrolase [Erysipelotrichaceae bacterium]